MSSSPLHKEGILLVNKPRGKTSFSLVQALRKKTGVRTIGHAGTLDPFATGLMILLIGKKYTRLSNQFLNQDKEYLATVRLGIKTDTFDCDGEVQETSDHTPSHQEIEEVLTHFQGTIEQTPPMFSAKKIGGQKLYHLARQGKTVERTPVAITLKTECLSFDYPLLSLHVQCSKGTYIRTLADDIGQNLGCWGHLIELTRTRCGAYQLEDALDGTLLFDNEPLDLSAFLQHSVASADSLV